MVVWSMESELQENRQKKRGKLLAKTGPVSLMTGVLVKGKDSSFHTLSSD
jgi:hypothetical protein